MPSTNTLRHRRGRALPRTPLVHQKSPRRTCGASNKGGSKKRREGGKNPGPGLAGEGRIRPWSSFIAKAKEAETDVPLYFLSIVLSRKVDCGVGWLC